MTRLHIPPEYDVKGRSQLWFVETGNDKIDDPINGLLTAVVLIGPIVALLSAGGAI